MIKFVLHGGMVSGKNSIGTAFTPTGKKIRYPTRRFKEWRDRMARQIWQFRNGMAILYTGPVHLQVDYFPADRKQRDATGMLDALFHLLENTNIVGDDAQVKSIKWVERPIDKSTPRVELSITPLEAANNGN